MWCSLLSVSSIAYATMHVSRVAGVDMLENVRHLSINNTTIYPVCKFWCFQILMSSFNYNKARQSPIITILRCSMQHLHWRSIITFGCGELTESENLWSGWLGWSWCSYCYQIHSSNPHSETHSRHSPHRLSSQSILGPSVLVACPSHSEVPILQQHQQHISGCSQTNNAKHQYLHHLTQPSYGWIDLLVWHGKYKMLTQLINKQNKIGWHQLFQQGGLAQSGPWLQHEFPEEIHWKTLKR